VIVGLVFAYLAGAVAFWFLCVALDDHARQDARAMASRIPVGSTVEQVEHLVGRPPNLRTGDGVFWDGNLSSMPDDVAVRGRFTHQWVVGRGRLVVRFDRHAVIYAHDVQEGSVLDNPVLAALWVFFFWWWPESD